MLIALLSTELNWNEIKLSWDNPDEVHIKPMGFLLKRTLEKVLLLKQLQSGMMDSARFGYSSAT